MWWIELAALVVGVAVVAIWPAQKGDEDEN